MGSFQAKNTNSSVNGHAAKDFFSADELYGEYLHYGIKKVHTPTFKKNSEQSKI